MSGMVPPKATKPASGDPRKSGVLQGLAAVLTGAIPVVAFISLPAALPRLMEHFSYVKDANVLVPIIMTAPAGCMAILSPFAGHLVDKYGRRNITLISCVIFLFFGLIPLFIDDIWGIILSRFGLGIAGSVMLPMSVTLICDYFDGRQRHQWFAIKGILAPIIFTIAQVVGGMLADVSWRAPFIFCVLVIPVFIFDYFVVWEPLREEATGNATATTSYPWLETLPILLISLVMSLIYYVEPVYIGLLFHDIGVKSASYIGVLVAIASIGVPLGGLLYSRISEMKESHLISLTLFLFSVGLLSIGFSTNYIVATVGALPQQIGAGMTDPVLWAWLHKKLSIRQRGRATGYWSTFFYGGQFLSPVMSGSIASAAGSIKAPFLVVGAVTLLLAALALRLKTEVKTTAV